MLNRLPKNLPTLADLLADLGNPTPESVAKALGVSASTVRRWKRTTAPRTALLALWWLSRWGQSAWDCEMHQRQALRWRSAGARSLEDATNVVPLRRPLARFVCGDMQTPQNSRFRP
jgi:hypothetical protein